jgi:hypothetical protein
MARGPRRSWINVVLIGAAAVLPFGTVLLVAAACVRAFTARPTRVDDPYDEWWKLRTLADAADGSYSRYAREVRSALGPCVCRRRHDRNPAHRDDVSSRNGTRHDA